MTSFNWQKKLTQNDLDKMVLEAMGEGGETKGEPDVITKLKMLATQKRSGEVTGER